MKVKNSFFLIMLSALFIPQLLSAQKSKLNDYNVRWTTPGVNAQGSMPIGNGDIGANVWVEKNGDLAFYISKTDAWSEIGRLLKLGKVVVSLTPNPYNEKTFSQELKLENGEILVSYGDTKIRFWIDANHPVIQTGITSKTPVQVKVTYENWRKEKRPIPGQEGNSVWGLGPNQWSKDCREDVFQDADMIIEGNRNKILSLHHNTYSIFEEGLRVQSLSGFKNGMADPLLHRNYGVMVAGTGLRNLSDTVLVSGNAAKNLQIQVFPLTQTGTVDSWRQQVENQASFIQVMNMQKRMAAHKKWWKDFWDRSYVFISSKDAAADKEAQIVTQGYILQRFINACSGRGHSPIKFNGSIFTTDTYNRKGQYSGYDADFRNWGGCYWWQNTRLPYWSMIASGDFDLMRPLFNMYMEALPLRKAATKKYYNHDGAFFPETMNFWGTYADSDYGCNRDSVPDGYTNNPYIRYYWQSGLELSLMMADYYSFTKSNAFAEDTLIPFVSEILTFYNQHWKRGSDGKILFDPSHSLETYHTAVNPLPEIVGIRKVAEKMLALPALFVNSERRVEWKNLINDLPSVPLRTIEGKPLLAPAHEYSNKANVENPEMYAVFPYRVYGLGKPGLDMAKRTFTSKVHFENGGWQQNSIQSAYLGLTKEAKKMIVESFSTYDENFRFPAFWGPNYDWTPDQCHGSVAMIALQRMLLQYEDENIILLPAWPKEWDVHFKLNIPGKKTYEGVYENEKLIKK
ncbi:DUF5703 domain-containing protein [Agriterribacter sp.]|uniref:DUF5703 domain-containing protein n=1 Tax=Agriterribacter sp. TaxID=2821509 RepID=UPI002C3D3F24|nr:DUF5703 domain-containing protein [Agriterribacter sp.]HTN08712.1 DUF5703 domain-containing protein [Agriterribacter sp.]